MDVIRVLALVAGSASIAVAGVVVVVYVNLYLRHRRTPQTSWRGLLPRHVALIGVSYIGLVLATMFEVGARINGDSTWRAPVYGITYALGLWALWDVLGHSRHRLHSLKPPPDEVDRDAQ